MLGVWLVAPPLSAALERGDPHRGGAAYQTQPRAPESAQIPRAPESARPRWSGSAGRRTLDGAKVVRGRQSPGTTGPALLDRTVQPVSRATPFSTRPGNDFGQFRGPLEELTGRVLQSRVTHASMEPVLPTDRQILPRRVPHPARGGWFARTRLPASSPGRPHLAVLDLDAEHRPVR
ncbi:hypothetical protein FPZ41_29410 [Streptomyces sp. K1PN6]|uniref:Uncharacterized protein n=1 Tax=Streptomyces acidicola TaxID=2596892 RepID=A0A5N8X0B4_9ACTN|nr:hypothetical protein [Streptomyces acidicola]